MKPLPCLLPVFLLLAIGGCSTRPKQPATAAGTYGDDLAFLRRHTDVVELSSADGKARVAIAPDWQGRVMTSTAGGEAGASHGWINRDFIAAGASRLHINPFGGEDRFWLGPEGGQFALYFAPGAPFDLEHWYTPAAFDTDAFRLMGQRRDMAQFQHRFSLMNFSGTIFDIEVNRTVRLLSEEDAWKALGVPAATGLEVVAFESVNRIRNTGEKTWEPSTGLISIWMLGMFNASPDTTVVVPLRPGPTEAGKSKLNADYFGPVPAERLVVRDAHAFFRGDGRYRSKIGVGPSYVQPILGSYNPSAHLLTLVQFTLPPAPAPYVNSQWRIQENPYGGDVVNSYSDDGKLGGFYELESSSPAAALAPAATFEHVHRTLHLSGDKVQLDRVARACLGVGLDEIATALP